MPNEVFVNGYSINFGRKESFFTHNCKQKNGKVLFNSRWHKIHSNISGNLHWIIIEGNKFSVVAN